MFFFVACVTFFFCPVSVFFVPFVFFLSQHRDVVPSRKRGSEEVGPPDDPNLTPAGVTNGHQRNGETDLASQRRHGFRARPHGGLRDRLKRE